MVCPTQTIPLAATQSLGRVLPGRAVSVSFSKEHSPDDYVRGALNLQQAGALVMVIKIGSSQRASDYVQERVCGVGAGARAGSQVLKVPVLLIDAQLGFWQDDDRCISSDDDCSVDDNGEFRLVYELSRAAYRDPHQMNLRLPSVKAIDDMRLPIETENGVLQTNVKAFIKVLERQEEQSPNRGLWIKTLNSITAAAQVRARSALSRFPLIISFALKPAWVNDALLLGRAATAANTTPEVWVAPVILDFLTVRDPFCYGKRILLWED